MGKKIMKKVPKTNNTLVYYSEDEDGGEHYVIQRNGS